MLEGCQVGFKTINFVTIITLLENPKGQVELGNPTTRAEVKLCLFLITPALEIVFHKIQAQQKVIAKCK